MFFIWQAFFVVAAVVSCATTSQNKLLEYTLTYMFYVLFYIVRKWKCEVIFFKYRQCCIHNWNESKEKQTHKHKNESSHFTKCDPRWQVCVLLQSSIELILVLCLSVCMWTKGEVVKKRCTQTLFLCLFCCWNRKYSVNYKCGFG